MLRELIGLVRDIAARIATIARAADEWRQDRKSSKALAQIMAHPQADPLLTADEAAAYTKQHVKTILSDAREGLLATVRRSDGGPVRVRLSDLNRYVDQHHRQATGEKSKSIDDINWNV